MTGHIALEGVSNTRDLGGTKGADGRPLRTGALIRSGTLAHATAHDLATLAQHRVRLVIDLRCDVEANAAPNRAVPGARMERLPVLSSLMPGVSRDEESDKRLIERMARSAARDPNIAADYLANLYRTIMTDAYAQKQYAAFVHLVAEHNPADGAILWNCTAGKDRVGMATVFVLECLGVSRADIYRDYLLTNCHNEKTIRAVARRIPHIMRPRLMPALKILFGAKPAYLDAVYETAEELDGSMDAFLCNRLGADERLRALMRAHYLV